MKNYELNTRKIESRSLSSYQDYFELVYYNNFCRGYVQIREDSWCSDNIASSGMNVVIQYLINDNRATAETIAASTNRQVYRKKKLESSEIITVGSL